MKRNAKRQTNKVGVRVMRICAFLLCLTAVTSCLSARLLARYKVTSSASDIARVALWAAKAEIRTEAMEIDADNAYDDGEADDDYYGFTVIPGGSEVTSKYGVVVTLTNAEGITAWPTGVTAKLTNADGTTIIQDNDTTGVYSDLGTFDAGDTTGVGYRLYLKADETVVGGTYDVDISVTIEQVD